MAEAGAGEAAGASSPGPTRAVGRARWTEVAVYLGLTVVLTNLLGVPMLTGLIPADLLNVVVPCCSTRRSSSR